MHNLSGFWRFWRSCRLVWSEEACGGAYQVDRFCVQFGHEPRLMSPIALRPHVTVHKTDDPDAKRTAEAATRPTISFVPIKTQEQLDLQARHQARERLLAGSRPADPSRAGPSDGAGGRPTQEDLGGGMSSRNS